MEPKRYFRVLTIAGSDSSGGAGIQADLKTFSALGCYGMSVVTALTSQNTNGVRSIFDVSPEFVKEQLDAVLSDLGVDAVKIGMLNRSDIICTVADRLKHYRIHSVVLDPVMISKSGDQLLKKDAVRALKDHLLPLAKVITPNLPEASVLLNRNIQTSDEMELAARDLLKYGSQVVVLKGGHCDGPESNDFVCQRDLRKWLRFKRVITSNNHGTGCTFSSAIASFLSKGLSPFSAIDQAKHYLSGAIESGAHYRLGGGHGPVHHFYRLWHSENAPICP